jgi:hypothetical protein
VSTNGPLYDLGRLISQGGGSGGDRDNNKETAGQRFARELVQLPTRAWRPPPSGAPGVGGFNIYKRAMTVAFPGTPVIDIEFGAADEAAQVPAPARNGGGGGGGGSSLVDAPWRVWQSRGPAARAGVTKVYQILTRGGVLAAPTECSVSRGDPAVRRAEMQAQIWIYGTVEGLEGVVNPCTGAAGEPRCRYCFRLDGGEVDRGLND